MKFSQSLYLALILVGLCSLHAFAEEQLTLEQARQVGIVQSRLKRQPPVAVNEVPKPRLEMFESVIWPVLRDACTDCHGADEQEGNFRIDSLEPDLVHGQDASWWIEVLAAISKREMPPETDSLADADRAKLVDFLTRELQIASLVRRDEQSLSSFRRMTRYEYNYVLQDLLGLPFDFAADLPPEVASTDGFQNSSDTLHLSANQFATYRTAARSALQKAVVRGDRPPELTWTITMTDAAKKQLKIAGEERQKRAVRRAAGKPTAEELEDVRRPSGTHFWNASTGQAIKATWNYRQARYAWEPMERGSPPAPAENHEQFTAVLPAHQRMTVELGNQLPDSGMMRIKVWACRASGNARKSASLRWELGFQASNNSSAVALIGDEIAVTAPPGSPEVYEWLVPLESVRLRNPLRRTAKMGETPNPSEYLRLRNTAVSQGTVEIESIEVTAPVYEQWPPESHARIFIARAPNADDEQYANAILASFMQRAWRRPITDEELQRKTLLYRRIRPTCSSFQQAILEVLSGVLASPNFLYVQNVDKATQRSDLAFATRLSLFLWCSLPDKELLDLARRGKLKDTEVLKKQTLRMLADPRGRRMAQHFVEQWLGMQLLEYLQIDKKAYPHFDDDLRAAMQKEPIALFNDMLRHDSSILDFLHADYALVNERLALHYGIEGVYGNQFRRVALDPRMRRGGILTQAGLLAMNSDGLDSHPLKRGIWLLERLLNDPPPPPPPAVPEIDLADPRIAKMTLKERIEDHRNDPACYSCHAKIDPWGIAFEHYDAAGSWRTQIGEKAVDATSVLPGKHELAGVDGLKRFLLSDRQDQFVIALTHKLSTFALGRPLNFSDRAQVEQIAFKLRQENDGLATLISLIVQSDLFRGM